MEQTPILSSGSVVFSLPHLRDAIFFYHAHHLVQEREKRLREIDRAVQPGFFPSRSGARVPPESFFAARLRALSTESNISTVLQALGLNVATYLDLLATRPNDIALWLVACSTLGGSRKWLSRDGRSHRLEALPRANPRKNILPENPHSSAIEMLYHGGGANPEGVYTVSYSSSAFWGNAEGLAQILRDHRGRIYLARILQKSHQQFPFTAAAERPELLYSSDTPFFPYHDVIEYSDTSDIGIVITECPPYPLSHLLAPGQAGTRNELRRVLEYMRDLFTHLVTLEKHQVSLKGQRPGEGWRDSFVTAYSRPSFLSAYLEPATSNEHPGRLARSDLYEERLPEAPADAWPIAPLEGDGGIAGLPWSQLTAYSDPRVKGPKTWLHGVFSAASSDSDQTWKEPQSRWGHIIRRDVPVVNRFHCDLMNFTDCILARFFPLSGLDFQKVVELLEKGVPAEVYEDCLANGADSGACNPSRGHSGLFSFCANCFFKDRSGILWKYERGPDKCSVCSLHCLVNAMPKAIQELLLRIMKPEIRADGSSHIVTAQEALPAVEEVISTELPKIVRVYELWAEKQKRVQRLATAGPLPLERIQKDLSADRWILFELLRGNLMNAKFTRKDRKERKELVKAHLDFKRKQADETQGKAKEEQKQATLIAAAVGGDCQEDAAMTAAEEAEVLEALLAASYVEAKRSGDVEDGEGMTSPKKLKTA